MKKKGCMLHVDKFETISLIDKNSLIRFEILYFDAIVWFYPSELPITRRDNHVITIFYGKFLRKIFHRQQLSYDPKKFTV